MEIYWTSNKPIKGLRHFVLVNKFKEKKQIKMLFVSVIDVDISIIISYEELIKSGNWTEGWLNLPKAESITKDYSEFKLSNNSKDGVSKKFVNDNSIFNIS